MSASPGDVVLIPHDNPTAIDTASSKKDSEKNSEASKPAPRPHRLWFALVLVALLCVAVGIAIFLAVRLNADSKKRESESPVPSPRVYFSNLLRDTDFEGSVKLMRTSWDPGLTDRGSPTFRRMASEKELFIDDIFLTSNISDVYNYSVVREFRQGSVVVMFQSKLLVRQSLATDDLKLKHDRITSNPAAWLQAFREGMAILALRQDVSLPPGDINVDSLRAGTITDTTTAKETTTESTTSKTTTTASENFRCGEVRSLPGGSRIVNGRPTDYGEYPWLVSLWNKHIDMNACGGSIIDSLHVLTAAHCFEDYIDNEYGRVESEGVVVIAGKHEYETYKATDQEQRATIAKVYMHQDYDPVSDTSFNDIALIRLASPLTFNSRVAPVCLPRVDTQVPQQCVAAGWGTTTEGDTDLPVVLQAVTLQAYNQTECKRVFEDVWRLGSGASLEDIGYYLNEGVMCASNFTHGGGDTCQGDSGGPLFCLERGEDGRRQYTQYGVVSWGNGCGEPGKPGFYTYVPHYLDWIENIAKPIVDKWCVQSFCLQLIEQSVIPRQSAVCSLLESTIDCMQALDQTGLCPRYKTRRQLAEYLSSQNSQGETGSNLWLTASTECPDSTQRDACENPQLLMTIAENFCNLTADSSTAHLCLRVIPSVGQCVTDVIVKYLGNCSVEQVAPQLAAASDVLQRRDQLCSEYCPDFQPYGCLDVYSTQFMRDFLEEASSESLCRLAFYKSARCLRSKLQLIGRPCEENKLRLSVSDYFGMDSSMFNLCDAAYPELREEPPACENPALLDTLCNSSCQHRLSGDPDRCSELEQYVTEVTEELRRYGLYCPHELVVEHLGLALSCNVTDDTDRDPPSMQCSGLAAANAMSELALSYCDVIINKLNITWHSGSGCSILTDLLTCLTSVANYEGYLCTEQDVATLTLSMPQFPVDNISDKLTSCAISPSSELELLENDLCEDPHMARLYGDYSCAPSLQAVVESSRDTFCDNLDTAAECVNTAFSFQGRRCDDLHLTVYMMLTPYVYHLQTFYACPSSTKVRLVDGSVPWEGRLEVFINGQWGTVCDDSFGAEDAAVACRMLGYDAKPTYKYPSFGEGTVPILLDELECTGLETNLLDCVHVGVGNHDCSHIEDAGVTCEAPTNTSGESAPNSGNSTLFPPASPEETDRICRYFPVWSSILAPCHSSFHQLTQDSQCSDLETTVTCMQRELAKQGAFCEKRLIHERVQSFLSHDQQESCQGVTFDMPPACKDSVTVAAAMTQCEPVDSCLTLWALMLCMHKLLDPRWEECSAAELEAVIQDNVPHVPLRVCQDYDVRRMEDGSVMTYVQGEWRWLCADDWGQAEADVICRQLGYAHGRPSLVLADRSRISDDVYVTCDGSETSLEDCHINQSLSCSTSHVAAVVCYNTVQEFSLRHGNSSHYGFVFFANSSDSAGQEALLRADLSPTVIDILCQSLGHTSGEEYRGSLPAPGDPGSSLPIWQAEFHESCFNATLPVSNLDLCRDGDWQETACAGGGATQDCVQGAAKVFCYPSKVRLHTGFLNTTGIVQIYKDGVWWDMCHSDITQTTADVICRGVMASTTASAIILSASDSHFPNHDPLTLRKTQVTCTDADVIADDCVTVDTGSECDEPYDTSAMVVCYDGEEPSGNITGWRVAADGVVMAQRYGTWGTVCDYEFYEDEVQVVCKTLGFSDGTYADDTHFHDPRVPMWVDAMVCQPDTNQSADECSITFIGPSSSCGIDANVECF